MAVKGGISIQWDGSRMRMSTMYFGYDPKLVMTEKFSQVLEERSSNGFAVVLNHVPELDDNYEETGTIGESYLEIFTDIPSNISKDKFTRLIQNRTEEIAEFIKSLNNYEFNQPAVPANRTNKDYFTFNVHDSALVVGQTGTGKTELVRQHIRRLEQAFTPDQMKYVIFDFKQVEFDSKHADGAKQECLYSPIRFGTGEAPVSIVRNASKGLGEFNSRITKFDNDKCELALSAAYYTAGSIKIAYCIPAIAVTMLEILEPCTTYRARTASSCKRQLHQHHITERERINPSKYDEHLPIEKLEAARIQNTRVNHLIEIFEKGLDWEELKMEVEV